MFTAVVRRRRDERKREVLKAATAQIRAAQLEWAAALTFGELAIATGIDQAQIARDFGSKHELVGELIAYLTEVRATSPHHEETVEQSAVELTPGTPVGDALLAFGLANFQLIVDHLEIVRYQNYLWSVAGPGSREWQHLEGRYRAFSEQYTGYAEDAIGLIETSGGVRRDYLTPAEFVSAISAVQGGLVMQSTLTPDLIAPDLFGRVFLLLVTGVVGTHDRSPTDDLNELEL